MGINIEVGVVFIFLAVVAYQDLTTRLIRDWWTLPWIAFFLFYNGVQHHLEPSIIGLVGMGVLLFIPGLLGWLGGGDWKMGMALGAGGGLVPALLLFALGFLLAPLLKTWLQRVSRRYVDEENAKLIPVGVLVFVADILFSVGVLMIER
nr:prepilin peptidase [Sulfoacidibacillus ferrooxidans]